MHLYDRDDYNMRIITIMAAAVITWIDHYKAWTLKLTVVHSKYG